MMTGDSWKEQSSFGGHGSAVVMVIDTQECPAKTYEFRIECIGLDSFSKAVPMAAYIWDKRETNSARMHYQALFKKGTFWRFSGTIEYDDCSIIFVDPTYMPFTGDACRLIEAVRSDV